MVAVVRMLAAAAAAALALAGCEAGDAQAGRTPSIPVGEPAGVYAGTLPCSNCSAIEARLWMRPDGRFFLRQRYAGDDGTADRPSYSVGRWHWDDVGGQLVLAGAGPERRLVQLDADRLQLQTPSPLPHLLTRDREAAPFADTLRLDGESVVGRSGIAFRECITGLELELAPGDGYQDLLRHHRRLNRNGPAALTEIDAHLEIIVGPDDSLREVLVVDRFLNLKPRVGCGE